MAVEGLIPLISLYYVLTTNIPPNIPRIPRSLQPKKLIQSNFLHALSKHFLVHFWHLFRKRTRTGMGLVPILKPLSCQLHHGFPQFLVLRPSPPPPMQLDPARSTPLTRWLTNGRFADYKCAAFL